jgi:hypothetical protein
VPLVTQHLEAAIREELSIEPAPPAPGAALNGHPRGRLWRRPARASALDDLADIGPDRSRD